MLLVLCISLLARLPRDFALSALASLSTRVAVSLPAPLEPLRRFTKMEELLAWERPLDPSPTPPPQPLPQLKLPQLTPPQARLPQLKRQANLQMLVKPTQFQLKIQFWTNLLQVQARLLKGKECLEDQELQPPT